jgi:hypothetical protein
MLTFMQTHAHDICHTHISSSPVLPRPLLLLQQQQQQPPSQQQRADSLKKWRTLEATAVLPGPEQLLLALEVALLQPETLPANALHLWLSTVNTLDRHGCAAAAAELLLQPFLLLLGPAVVHSSAALGAKAAAAGLPTNYALTAARLLQHTPKGELPVLVVPTDMHARVLFQLLTDVLIQPYHADFWLFVIGKLQVHCSLLLLLSI